MVDSLSPTAVDVFASVAVHELDHARSSRSSFCSTSLTRWLTARGGGDQHIEDPNE